MKPSTEVCFRFPCNWKRVGQIFNSVHYKSQVKVVGISYDGSRICVGDRLAQVNGQGERGSTRVYELDGTTWTQVGQTLYGSKYQDQRAYCSLSPDGQRLIIGGTTASNAGFTRNGKVEVLDYDGSAWVQVGQDIYGAGTWYHIGSRPQIVGEDNSIMAHKSENPNQNTGYVRVYRLVENQWQNIGDLYGQQQEDRFGGDFQISHDGTRVIAGSLYSETVCTGGSSYMGYAKGFIYRSDGNWEQMGPILCYVQAGNDQRFGATVTMSGDGNRVAVSARNWNGGTGYVVAYDIGYTNVDVGASYSYDQVGQILYGASSGTYFGRRLSMSYDGSRLLTNAPYDDSQRGLIRIYDFKNGQWEIVGTPFGGANVPYRALEVGNRATISGNGERVVFENRFYNNDSGQAFVFEYGKE